ncbi:hypothetical protein D3C73_1656940 [compost metagenome]
MNLRRLLLKPVLVVLSFPVGTAEPFGDDPFPAVRIDPLPKRIPVRDQIRDK